MRTMVWIAFLAVAGLQQPAQTATGFIEGDVRGPDAQPIADVNIGIRASGEGSFSASTVTDARGHFAFRNLQPGTYIIQASREGYLGGGLAQTSPAYSTIARVTANEPVHLSPITLTRAALIAGEITDSDGRPMSNLTVQFLRLTYDVDGRRTWEPGLRAETDDQGRYREFRLLPGEYYIRASRMLTMTAVLTVGDITTTYYPGVLDPAAAVPVVVGEGREGAASFKIPATKTYKISGKISREPSDASAFPLMSVVLTRRDRNEPIDSFMGTTLPEGSDGQFTLLGVRNGSYDLFVSARNPDGERFSRNVVEVHDEDVTVTPIVRPGVDIKGRLVIDGNLPNLRLTPGPLATILASAAANGGGGGGGVGGGTAGGGALRISLSTPEGAPNGRYVLGPLVEESGIRFQFPNVPEGTYLFSISGAPLSANSSDNYVADIRAGGRSVLIDGLVVGRDPIDSLEVVIADKGGSIDATITDKKPDAPAYVLLFPDGQRRKSQVYYRVITSNSLGHVTARGIPPGNYRILAADQFPQQYRSPEFHAKYEGRAVPVTIQRGLTTGGVVIPLISIKD